MTISLPKRSEETGAVARVLLAEARDPGQLSYQESDSKTAMQWMKRVLQNRLDNKPAQFMAPHARNLVDIIKARGQIQGGFSNYPAYSEKLAKRLQGIIDIANNPKDKRSTTYAQFVQNALDTAAAPAVADPSQAENSQNNPICAWVTENSSPPTPKGHYVFYKEKGGNDFYTLIAIHKFSKEKHLARLTAHLKLGAVGADVTALQRKLADLGYTANYRRRLQATGYFDLETEYALESFQSDHGLAPTGAVDPLTQGKLQQPILRIIKWRS